MAVRAIGPTVHHRQSTGRRWEYRDRSGREGRARRLYAAPDQLEPHGQRDTLRQTQLQFHSRYRACRGYHSFAARLGAEPPCSSDDPSGIYRSCEGQSWQTQLRIGRQWQHTSCGRRTVQDDDRHRHRSRSLSRCGASPYRSPERTGPAMFMVPGVVTEHIKTGKLRAVAVTAATRSDVLPDVPTVNSVVTGYEATTWFGIGAPKNTPSEIVDKLNKEINAAVADPKIKAQLTDLGGTSLTRSPGEFGKLIADNTEKWGKVIRAANIKPE